MEEQERLAEDFHIIRTLLAAGLCKLKFPFEQGVVGLDMDVDDGDIDEYADVAMPDPQQQQWKSNAQ
jgi:hypothetical protein